MSSTWTEEKIARWVNAGRGQGQGSHYRPWLTIAGMPGYRLYSSKFGRCIELLSDAEVEIFRLVERSPDVVSVQEYWPIDRELSWSIARSMGVRHPTYPGTRVREVLTVDLLVTFRSGITEAIECQAETRMERPRAISVRRITRACLKHYGHQHRILVASKLPKQLTAGH